MNYAQRPRGNEMRSNIAGMMYQRFEPNIIPPFMSQLQFDRPTTEIKLSEFSGNVQSPEIWGEAFWFMIHLGAANVPEIIHPQDGAALWNFIEALPLMFPCEQCALHARKFIQAEGANKNEIISSRDNFFAFTVKFHNYVNERQKKPAMSVADAFLKYTGRAKVTRFQFS